MKRLAEKQEYAAVLTSIQEQLRTNSEATASRDELLLVARENCSVVFDASVETFWGRPLAIHSSILPAWTGDVLHNSAADAEAL